MQLNINLRFISQLRKLINITIVDFESMNWFYLTLKIQLF